MKLMDLTEFRNSGMLQEANRLFFHPLGLALAIQIEQDGTAHTPSILDYRDEGIYFGDAEESKASVVRYAMEEHHSEKRYNMNVDVVMASHLVEACNK